MATITIQINTGVGNVTRTRTVTGAHLTRMIAAYKAILGKVVASQGPPITYRDMTDEECILAWADGLLAGTKANVLNQEKGAASTTAMAGVSEITLT